MMWILKRAPWVALGAAAAWLLDDEHGAARRAELTRTVKAWTGVGTEPIDPSQPAAPPIAAR